MIKAIMLDLDGTLIQSEKLKSLSYAIAVQRLRGLSEPDQRAIEAYREIVGALVTPPPGTSRKASILIPTCVH